MMQVESERSSRTCFFAVRLRCTGWSTISTQKNLLMPIHLKQISARNYSLILWVVIRLGIKNVYDNWKFLARGPTILILIIEFLEEIGNKYPLQRNGFQNGYWLQWFQVFFCTALTIITIWFRNSWRRNRGKTSSKNTDFPRQGVFNHLLSLNSFLFQRL
jgi:hypothetical protein